MAIERTVYLCEHRAIRPIYYQYLSNCIPIELYLADYTPESGATATAYSYSPAEKTVHSNAATLSGTTITITPGSGFFFPGKCTLQVNIVSGESVAVTFSIEVYCESTNSEGTVEDITTVRGYAEQASESAAASAASADSAKAYSEAAETEVESITGYTEKIDQNTTDISEIKTDITAMFPEVSSWITNDTEKYPTGWRTGYYYKLEDGTYKYTNSYLYICTAYYLDTTRYPEFTDGTLLRVSPPVGFGVDCSIRVFAIDPDTSKIEYTYGSLEDNVGETINVPIDSSLRYHFTIGRFPYMNSDTYLAKAEFMTAIKLERIHSVETVKDTADTALENTRTYGNIGMFDKIAVCGYSWDSGYFYVGSTNYTRRNHSWIAYLARKHGIDFRCYGVPSGTLKAPDSTYSAGECWQSKEYGLPLVLSDAAAGNPCDLYWLRFGGNDKTKLKEAFLGTIDDIHDDYTENPDTYYGNFGRVLDQIIAAAPKAHFVMSYTPSTDEVGMAYDTATLAIAAKYGIPTVNWLDDYVCKTWIRASENLVGAHPIPQTYAAMADAADRLFSACVKDNFEYFMDFVPIKDS